MPEPQIPSRGSRALTRILRENGPIAQRLKARFDKSVLWRWSTGRRRPSEVMAPVVAHLTDQQIPQDAWIPRKEFAELVKGL